MCSNGSIILNTISWTSQQLKKLQRYSSIPSIVLANPIIFHYRCIFRFIRQFYHTDPFSVVRTGFVIFITIFIGAGPIISDLYQYQTTSRSSRTTPSKYWPLFFIIQSVGENNRLATRINPHGFIVRNHFICKNSAGHHYHAARHQITWKKHFIKLAENTSVVYVSDNAMPRLPKEIPVPNFPVLMRWPF